MDRAEILSRMKDHFEDQAPPNQLERFADVKAMELIDESIDVVEFLFFLEEEMGSKVNASQIGPALADMTFGELADKLAALTHDEKSVQL